MKIVPETLGFENKLEGQCEERKAPSEYHFVGSVKKVKGHILFEYNLKTKKWAQAVVERRVSIDLEGNPVYETKATRHKDCVYVQALNLKNAKKKLKI